MRRKVDLSGGEPRLAHTISGYATEDGTGPNQDHDGCELVRRPLMLWHADMSERHFMQRLLRDGMIRHEECGRNNYQGCFRITQKGRTIAYQDNRNSFIMFNVDATLRWLGLPRTKD